MNGGKSDPEGRAAGRRTPIPAGHWTIRPARRRDFAVGAVLGVLAGALLIIALS